MCSVFPEPGSLFDLVLLNQKGERLKKELTLDGTPKTQDC